MRTFFSLLIVTACMMVVSGCGGRPDPRANPDFDEEAYEDPTAAGQRLSEDWEETGRPGGP